VVVYNDTACRVRRYDPILSHSNLHRLDKNKTGKPVYGNLMQFVQIDHYNISNTTGSRFNYYLVIYFIARSE